MQLIRLAALCAGRICRGQNKSQDFDSIYLKTKKHWNSFTTEFFLSPDVLLEWVQSGKVQELRNGV